jgi:hypothetical protein
MSSFWTLSIPDWSMYEEPESLCIFKPFSSGFRVRNYLINATKPSIISTPTHGGAP